MDQVKPTLFDEQEARIKELEAQLLEAQDNFHALAAKMIAVEARAEKAERKLAELREKYRLFKEYDRVVDQVAIEWLLREDK